MLPDILTKEHYRKIIRKRKECVLAYWDCADDALRGLESNPELVSLGFHRCGNITDESLRYLSCLKKLKRLYFCNAELNGFGLKYLADIDLEYLEMIYMNLNPESYQYFSNFKNIKKLFLYHMKLDSNFLAYIENYTKLEKLDLSFNVIDGQYAKTLENFTNMKLLYLESSNLFDDFLIYIGRLNYLERLSLINNHITHRGVKELKSLKNLRNLTIEMNPVGDEAMKSIAQLPKLRILEIGDANITDKGIEYLADGPAAESLEWIEIANNSKITKNGILSFHKKFPKVDHVKASVVDGFSETYFDLERENGITMTVSLTDENISQSYIEHHLIKRELPEDYSPTLYSHDEESPD